MPKPILNQILGEDNPRVAILSTTQGGLPFFKSYVPVLSAKPDTDPLGGGCCRRGCPVNMPMTSGMDSEKSWKVWLTDRLVEKESFLSP